VSLEGTLESFGIGEIFQLISSQAKTGVLEIETDENKVRIRFVNGELLDAFPGKKDPSRVIGAMLVRSSLITQRQLEYALGVQKKNLRKIGDILIRMGAVRTSEFQEMLALQRMETAYGLLRLRRGKYIFKPGAVEFEEGVDTLMNVGAILMEGSRQIDEWPDVLKRIPTDGRIYRRDPKVTPMRELSEDESVVYNLLDGTLTVREVIDRSRLGEFAAWSAMANIYDEQLIAPVVKKRRKPIRKSREVNIRPRSPLFIDLVAAIAILFAAFMLFVTPQIVPTSSGMGIKGAVAAAKGEFETLAVRVEAWQTRSPPAPEVASPFSDR
jgi:hypothetical protein